MFIRPLFILCIAANSYAANDLLIDEPSPCDLPGKTVTDQKAVWKLVQERGADDAFLTSLMPGYDTESTQDLALCLQCEAHRFNREHGDQPNPSGLSTFSRMMLNIRADWNKYSCPRKPLLQAIAVGSNNNWKQLTTKEEFEAIEPYFENAPFSVDRRGNITSELVDPRAMIRFAFMIQPINTDRPNTRKLCNLDAVSNEDVARAAAELSKFSIDYAFDAMD